MALVVKDRVRESSTTTGTGTITLSGAYVGFVTFASSVSDGSTVFYCIHNTAPGYEDEWEVGYGTYSAGTLTRDTLYSSSTGSSVNFSAGTKEVFITYPSEAAVFEDNSGNVTVTGKLTVGTGPSADLDVATKGYVDNAVSAALHYHDPVRAESPSALTVTYNNGTAGVGATLTNAGTQAALVLDGITLNVADRVLIYTQTDATQNGVYTVTDVGSGSTNWVLTRATDADSYSPASPNSLGQGDAFYVQEGDTAAGESYVCTTQGTITFGTTAITFSQFAATPAYTGTGNINVTGQVISLTGVIDETNGGTGSSSYTTGDILYASGATTLAQLPGNTTTTTKYLTQTGTGSASAAPTWTALAASATTDTTNASNISSGTLPSARISGSYTGITGVGTLTAGTWNASTVGVGYGGTGLTSYTTGDIVYASGSTTLSKLADVATGNALISGGVGAAPSWGKVALTTHVSGTLPIANGGTNSTTADGGFNNLAPSQTGNSGKFLTTNGSTTSWGTPTAANNGTLTMAVSGTGLSGSASFTADQAGNSTFTVASNATNANTASTIVARDASGNFSAGTITASLNGNASTASTASATSATLTRGSYLTGSNFNGSAATTWAVDATSANTASKVVARDASGNFSAGTITAALSGNASTATTLQTARTINGTSFNGSADIVTSYWGTTRTINGVSVNGSTNYTIEPYVEDDEATNATRLLTFVDNSTAGYKRLNEDSGLSYNPSTNTLTTGTFSGALSGNATTASSTPLLSALSNYVWSASTTPTSYNQGVQVSFVSSSQGFQDYGSVMTMNTYSGGGGALQMYVPYSPTYGGTGLQVRFGNYDVSSGNSWTSWKTLLASDNYNSYSPTLTGGGASGTWGISITGNAATATNSDQLDGYHASTTRNAANTVPVRDGSGYLQLGWINTTSGATTSTINKIYSSDDDYIRYITPATFRSQVIDGYYLPLAGGTATGTINAPTFNATSLVSGGFQGIDLDSAASPSFTWSGDLDTGMYRYGTNNIGFTAGNNIEFIIYTSYTYSPGSSRAPIFYDSNNTSYYADLASTGTSINAAGSIVAASDVRLKDNIETIPNALEKTLKLRGVTYTRKDGDNKSRQVGVIAQEVLEVLPEAVVDGPHLSVAYGNMVGLLIEAIKEQQKQIDELKQLVKGN